MKKQLTTLLLICCFIGITSFSFNDAEKKTYWLASCVVVCKTREVSAAAIVEASKYDRAKIAFEKWLNTELDDDIKSTNIDKGTYTIHLVTPESIVK